MVIAYYPSENFGSVVKVEKVCLILLQYKQKQCYRMKNKLKIVHIFEVTLGKIHFGFLMTETIV